MTIKKKLNEFTSSAGNSSVPDPVEGGASPHANRPLDNTKSVEKMQGEPKNKWEVIQYFNNYFKDLNNDDMMSMFNSLKDQYKNTKEKGDESNMKSITTHEDIDFIIDGVNISEEIKSKIHLVFETYLQTKLAEKTLEIESEYETKLENRVVDITADICVKLDEHLESIIEDWFEENKAATVTSIKMEMNESFMEGLQNLFKDHYVYIPDDKFDLVESMGNEIAELSTVVKNAFATNKELKEHINSMTKKEVILNNTSDLSEMQKDKLNKLLENVLFVNETDFLSKFNILKIAISENKIAKETTLVDKFSKIEPVVNKSLDKNSFDMALESILKNK